MAQDYDIVDRLEKQIEGSNLALAAVAEVLHKMDSRISKAEEEEDFELAQEEDAIEKQEIIKAVASEVYGLIKADQGMPGLEASERKASGSSKSEKSADDSAEAVNTKTDMKSQQATIQAMQNQLNLLKEGFPNGDEDKDMDEENGEDKERKDRGEDEDEQEEMGLSHYSVENAAEGYPVLENMQKQIDSLRAQLSGTFDLQKAVQNETEGRLRKMGFREETSLQRPTQIRYADTSMGVDGTAPITKATEGGDVVDQMMQLSYQDLRRLQENIESGDTDGVPRELLG